jgi:hypothetical protein
MSGRTAKFVSAVFVNILAGLPLATVAHSEPVEAEGCLSTPWGEAPAGSHWRYHIDHLNKSKCWFLRRDGVGALSQASRQQNNTAAPQEIAPPAPAAPPPPPAKPSVADARAEFRPQDNSAASAPANATGDPSNATVNETGPANASVWNATAAVATRWPNPPATSPAPNTAPATATAVNDAPQPSVDPSQAILPSIPFSRLSVPIRSGTIAGLIAAIIVALAFAALLARRRGIRLVRRRVARSGRGPLWETTDDDRIVLSDQHPSPDGRGYRFARGVPSAATTRRARELARRPPRHASR